MDPATTATVSSLNDTIPYSSQTLDMYMQLASSTSPSTLQTYESTLHSLAASTTQRSVRFQPAKPALRAFTHSLAADWGFATESFDPEPHRHVFVLKPTSWLASAAAAGRLNNDTGIGIGGLSVGECVKKREQQRMKEREAQRIATIEAKAQKEAAKSNSSGDGTEGGWAQVASSKAASSNAAKTVGASAPPIKGSIYMALAAGSGWTGSGSGSGSKERLVLRSGVGAGKQMKSQSQSKAQGQGVSVPEPEVVDSWEEEEVKEEQEEEKNKTDEDQKNVEDAPVAVEGFEEVQAQPQPQTAEKEESTTTV